MTPKDTRDGDPASRSEGVFGTVLKSLFGRADDERADDHDREPRPLREPEPPPVRESRPLREPEPPPLREPIAPREPAAADPAPPIGDRLDYLESLEAAAAHIREADAEPTRDLLSLELEDLGRGTAIEVESPSPEPEPETEIEPETAAASVAIDVEGPAGETTEILEELHHPSAGARIRGLQRLLAAPEDAPVVAVAARLQDPAPEVRQLAIEVLDAMSDEAVVLLLLEAMTDPSEEVRRSAEAAIRSRRSDATTDLLRKELHLPARRWAAARVLAEIGEVDALVRAAASDNPDMRVTAQEALEGTGANTMLLGELDHANADRRRIAAERLGAMRARDAVDGLIERLQDPDRGVRIKAAEALGRIGDQRATHALKRGFIWDPDAAVVVAMGNAIRKLAGARVQRAVEV